MATRASPEHQQRTALIGEMFELFRLIQRRNRFVGSAWGLPLGLSDAHALVEIDSYGGLSAAQLGQLLCLKKASMFYLVDRLKRRRLVQVKPAAHDKRATVISLTATGIKLLQKLDALANKQLDFLKASFTESQTSALVRLLEKFSDLHGIPKLQGRSNEHPLRTSIRRGTRALGLTSNAIFGEQGLNALQWHALAEISSTPGLLTALQLCEILAVKPNTLSAALSGLEKQACITQASLETDRRKKALRLTDQGSATLAALKAGGCSRLSERLHTFSMDELQEFVTLLSILAGKGAAAPRELLQAAVYVEQVIDKATITRLRGLYVEHLVEHKGHWNLGSTILGDNSFIYAGFEQGEPISVAELVLFEERAVVSHFAVFASGLEVLGVEAFALAVCRTFLALYPFRAVLLPPALSKISVEGDLRARTVQDGVLVSRERE